MRCHILATNLDISRYGSVALVFHTIRRGFPTADLIVYGNGMSAEAAHLTASCCRGVGAQFVSIERVAHGEWIEKLVATETEPFWILDTDVVLFDKVQDWFIGQENKVLFSGRFEPTFWEDWTKTVHVSRLHPSLMWLNPQLLRAEAREYPSGQEFLSTVNVELFKWHWIANRERWFWDNKCSDGMKAVEFYDTCAGLWHGLIGTKFTDSQNEAFEHLYSGSYVHMMPNNKDKINLHDQVFMRPSLAKGLWDHQKRWYEENKI